MYKHKYELRKYVGQISKRPVYYDIKEGYSIEEYSTGMRNLTHKELRQIKAKFGDLEKKLKGWGWKWKNIKEFMIGE